MWVEQGRIRDRKAPPEKPKLTASYSASPKWSSNVLAPTKVTLNGGPTAIRIFEITGNLILSASVIILLIRSFLYSQLGEEERVRTLLGSSTPRMIRACSPIRVPVAGAWRTRLCPVRVNI